MRELAGMHTENEGDGGVYPEREGASQVNKEGESADWGAYRK